jgi:diguanylate cyclase (GGDEF)-like protein
MSSRPPPSLTRAATRIALIALSLLALLPPLVWLGVGAGIEHAQARATARAVALWLQALPNEVQDRDARLDAASRLLLPVEGGQVRWRVTPAAGVGADGRAGREGQVGDAPSEPAFTVVETARFASGALAEVQVERALGPLLAQTLWIALLGCGLALAGWRLGIDRAVAWLGHAETRMRSQASLDGLTGLLNREGLRRRLQRALDRHAADNMSIGLLLIDLDRFGLINETLGQASGDALLRSVADRIRAVTRSGDGLARLGGDQFAVHVDTLAGTEALHAMGRNLLRAFEAPHLIEGREIVATFSIGVAVARSDGGSVDGLLHQASLGVRSAKKQGGNRLCTYESGSMIDDGAHRMDLEQRLRGALGAGQFFVVYQPIVDAQSERLGTVEALLRWQDPDRGTISPVEFIPALEQTGLIVAVGRWVLREACLQAARWPGGVPMNVSVNLSPMQFAEPDFLPMVAGVLRETGLPPQRLQLEVTEGLLLDPTPLVLRKINALAELGVRLAIDDFGMGYSSLIYLKRFRLHTLKIDRMFVRDITELPEDRTIVQAIIDLGHGLGMRVTAEGVETRAQAVALREMGCDSLQGYLFGRPASVEALLSGPGRMAAGERGHPPARARTASDPPEPRADRQAAERHDSRNAEPLAEQRQPA